MPNGHVQYDACDVLHWRFTEQGYPTLELDRFDYSRGLRLLQLRGVRGYAPLPKMDTWKFWPWPSRNADRAEMERFAATCIDATRALLVSNPNDALDPQVRCAELAWLWFDPGWAVVAGFYLYVREAIGEPLRYVNEPVVEYPPDMTEEQRAMMAQILGNLRIGIGVEGLSFPNASAASCVVDLRNCVEILLTSTALHTATSWSELAGLSVFDTRATGLIIGELRERGLERESDQVAVRWSRPAK